MATCPECGEEIPVEEYDVDKGEIVTCQNPDCEAKLEVTSTSPLEFEVAFDDDDDDDLEDDDEEDEDEDEDEEEWEE